MGEVCDRHPAGNTQVPGYVLYVDYVRSTYQAPFFFFRERTYWSFGIILVQGVTRFKSGRDESL